MLSESEQIEAIYAIYPRKVGKRAALKAIEKAVERLTKGRFPQKIPMDVKWDAESIRRFLYVRARDYGRSPAGQKPPDPSHDFRPHPSTFFNQDRFFDDTAEWQKPNGSRNGKQAVTTASAETIARANARITELGGRALRAR